MLRPFIHKITTGLLRVNNYANVRCISAQDHQEHKLLLLLLLLPEGHRVQSANIAQFQARWQNYKKRL
jgi:hypothetical protein